MLSDAVSFLRCPVCQGNLGLSGGSRKALRCGAGHSFDEAKQGYFNLLTGKGTAFEADSAAMVAARSAFLGAGHYDALANALAAASHPFLEKEPALVLDAGTGTGHYLRKILDAGPADAIGVDISKFALRRAARLNAEAVNVVWDIWQKLPVADAVVDVLTVVFAPRNPHEFARVLKPTGRLIVVTPRPGHLEEIAARVGMLGMEGDKAERLAGTMSKYFYPPETIDLDIALNLTGTELVDLAFMGPAGHHLDRDTLLASVAEGERVQTTARFTISVFMPHH